MTEKEMDIPSLLAGLGITDSQAFQTIWRDGKLWGIPRTLAGRDLLLKAGAVPEITDPEIPTIQGFRLHHAKQ